MSREYPQRYSAPKEPTPDVADIPELLRQARAIIDECEHAIQARDLDRLVERLRRLEEIAVHMRYVVLATR